MAALKRRQAPTHDGDSIRSMSYREFRLPSDDEFIECLGVRPSSGDETGVSILRFEGGVDGSVEVVLDVLRRSVTVRLSIGGRQVVEVYREGAVSVGLFREPPQVTIDFETNDTKGSLRIAMPPAMGVLEAVLLA
jgi:hypothetical protein